MPDWGVVTVEAVLLLVVGVLLLGLWFLGRPWLLARRERIFVCFMRRPDASGGGTWSQGMARFRGARMEWFPLYAPTLKPAHTFRRDETRAVAFRAATTEDGRTLDPGSIIVSVDGAHAGVELAMGRPDATAFSSWTEAAPPGGDAPRLF